MKSHYCPEEKQELSYEGQCSWCGEKELTDSEIEQLAFLCWQTDEDLDFFNWNKFEQLSMSDYLVVLLLLTVAVGIHGLLHLGLEVYYNFNPME